MRDAEAPPRSERGTANAGLPPMPVGTDNGDDDQIAWRPTAAHIGRSRLARLMAREGVADFAALLARAADDPAWFWDATLRDLDYRFSRPYTRTLDRSRGPMWPRWFVGGGLNYAANALDKHVGEVGEVGGRRPAAGGEDESPDFSANGAKTAIIWEGDGGETRTVTYRELWGETNRLAAALAALGVARGDRVGIFLPMLPETAVALLAVAKVGAVAVPVFSGYGAEAVAARLADAGAVALVTADGCWRRGKAIDMKATADAALADTPTVRHVVVVRHLGGETPMQPGRDRDYAALIAAHPPDYPTADTDAEDPCLILYTSGTTGRPKGILHTHASFPVKATADLAHCFDVQADDAVLWYTDLGWMMGPWAIIGTQSLGATLVLFEGTPDFPHPDRLWELVARHRVTLLGVAPTVVRSLMAAGDEWPTRHDLSSLRALGSSGEAWNPEPWRWFFERVGGGRCPIINYSGGTEIAGGILSGFTILPLKPASFAAPVPGMAVDVVDDAGGSVRGAVGELVLRGPWPGMARGFWRDPERYEEAYWSRLPGLWVHGDFARVDADGFWYILGRSDDTIKVAGKRVGPAEVEGAAAAHPAVAEAAAVGVPHPVKGDVIAVFAVLRPEHAPTDALRGEIAARVVAALGKSLRPEAVLFVAALPKTRNAKVMRRLIRAAHLGLPLGDTTALENPAAVAAAQ